MKGIETRPYRPSSGTAGESFMMEFCFQCKKDSGKGCPIITDTYIYDVDDDKYPKQWIQDNQGARCTSFEQAPTNLKPFP